MLKEIHYLADCYGADLQLFYVKTKDGREIDFMLTRQGTPSCLLEVKWANAGPSENFRSFAGIFPEARKLQIVKEMDREKTYPDGLEIRSAPNWLATFSLSDS